MYNNATLHIRLEKNLKNELEKISNIYGTKLSTTIRLALEDYACRKHEITTKQISKINMENF